MTWNWWASFASGSQAEASSIARTHTVCSMPSSRVRPRISGHWPQASLCLMVTFLKHFWRPLQKILKLGIRVSFVETGIVFKLQRPVSNPGGGQFGFKVGHFWYISSCKKEHFWNLRDTSCAFALQVAFGLNRLWFKFQMSGAIRGDLCATFVTVFLEHNKSGWFHCI